jgi:hypothetical protein
VRREERTQAPFKMRPSKAINSWNGCQNAAPHAKRSVVGFFMMRQGLALHGGVRLLIRRFDRDALSHLYPSHIPEKARKRMG